MASARIVEPLRRTCWLKKEGLSAPHARRLIYGRPHFTSITTMPDTRSHNAPAATASASRYKQAAFPLGAVMLVGWAVWTFAFPPAPGWVHFFLTLGVFLVIL